jgi:hypothetical protein
MGVSAKKEGPLTFSSEALLSKTINKNCRKLAKIVKNHKKLQKLPKTGPNGLLKQFSSVFSES